MAETKPFSPEKSPEELEEERLTDAISNAQARGDTEEVERLRTGLRELLLTQQIAEAETRKDVRTVEKLRNELRALLSEEVKVPPTVPRGPEPAPAPPAPPPVWHGHPPTRTPTAPSPAPAPRAPRPAPAPVTRGPEPALAPQETEAQKQKRLEAERKQLDAKVLLFRMVTGRKEGDPAHVPGETEAQWQARKEAELAQLKEDPQYKEFGEISEKSQRAAEQFNVLREKLIKTCSEEADLRKQKRDLEKERDRAEGKDPTKAAELQYKILWVDNKLLKYDIKGMEAALEAEKEKVKVAAMDEFKTRKGAYLKENKEAVVKNLEMAYRAKHGKPLDYKLTAKDKNQIVKEQLQKEVLQHSKDTLLFSIVHMDEKIEKDRLEAVAQFEEKAWWKKTLEKFQNLPYHKRILITTGIAAGIGLATAAAAPVFGVTLGAGYVGYRAIKGVFGGAIGAGLNVFGQKVRGALFGRWRKVGQQEATSETDRKLKDAIGDAENWLNDSKKKLELAKIIDAQAVEYRKKNAALAKTEKWTALGIGVASGLAGGFIAGYGLNRIIDGITAPPPSPAIIDDCWKNGKAAIGGGVSPEMFYEGTPAEVGGGVSPEMFYEGTPPDASGGGVGGGVAPEMFYEPNAAESAAGAPATPDTSGVIPASGIEIAGENGRDSVWRMVRHQVETQYGARFTNMDPAQKTYAIDFFKDQVAANPEKFNPDFHNIDQTIPRGTRFNFSSLFENQAEADKGLDNALGLSDAAKKSITTHDKLIADWVSAHKGEPLTTGKIDEILGLKKAIAIAPPELPSGDEGGVFELKPKGTTLDATTAPETGGEEGGVYQLDVKPEGTPPKVGGGVTPEIFDRPGEPPALEIEEELGATTPQDMTPGAESPPGTPALEAVSPGGGETLTPLEAAFGSRMEASVASYQMGFKLGEYGAIKNVTLEKLFEEIPSRDAAWEVWRGEVPGKAAGLPHYGIYWHWQFAKQIELAEYIRGFEPKDHILKLTVSQFLQMVGPR